MMGGGELAREFLKADLVDAMYLGIVPALLGKGIPLFPERVSAARIQADGEQELLEGLIALKYERARKKAKAKS